MTYLRNQLPDDWALSWDWLRAAVADANTIGSRDHPDWAGRFALWARGA